MSTYWGLRCEDCRVSSPHWWNHGAAELEAVLRIWPTIKALEDAMRAGLWHLELRWLAAYDEPSPSAFLRQHDGHHLGLENEYGRVAPLVKSDS